MSDQAGHDEASETPDVDLARRAIDGEQEAFGLLFGRWFDRAFDVAWHIHYDRDTAADSVADAFAAAWQQIGQLRQPESFGGWLLRITRNQALSRLRKEQRSRPVGEEDVLVSLDPREGDDPGGPLGRDEQRQLVWAASAALGDEDASLLNLHLRHHLEPAELAEELGVRPNAAHQRLHRLRDRLGDAIGAWLLWHHGQPLCSELASSVGSSEGGFDKATARSVLRHAKRCDECAERRSHQTRPEMLFSLAPLVMADPAVRGRVATTLTGTDASVTDEVVAGRWEALNDRDLPEPGGSKDGEGLPQPSSSNPAVTDGVGEGAGHRMSGGLRNLSGEHPVLTGIGTMAAVLAVGALIFGAVPRMSGPGGRTEAVATGDVTVTSEPGPDPLSAPVEDREGRAGLPAKVDGGEDPEGTDGESGPETGAEVPVSPSASPPVEERPTSPPPTDEPPSDPVPTDDPPPTDPPPTDPPEPAGRPPEVVDFEAEPLGYCDNQDRNVEFHWTATDAGSATLRSPGGAEEAVPVEGTVTRCAELGTWTLHVTGAGGTDSQTVEVEQPVLY